MTQYYDDTAKDYAERAEAAAESASQSKQQASTAATTATTQASIATNAAQNAAVLVKSELENDVRAMKDAALSAASQASANAAAASGSAVDASHDAIDADQARQAAQAAQTAAETAQTAAETAMGNAASSAGAAAASSQAAATSETNASGSASAAATSESNAATSESNAETSAQNAATSETNAENSAKLSQSWAVGGTGVRQDEDTNNAKYYAELAEHFSPVSKADKVTGGDTDGMVAGLDAEGNLTNTEIPAENVAQKDGYYEDMTVGRAENLIDPQAPATRRKFGFDTACGDISITDNGNAIIKAMYGTTYVANQLVKPYETVTESGTRSLNVQHSAGNDAKKLELYGRSVVRNQLVTNGDYSDGINGWRGDVAVQDGKIVCTVPAGLAYYYYQNLSTVIPSGHVVLLHIEDIDLSNVSDLTTVRTMFYTSGFGTAQNLGNTTDAIHKTVDFKVTLSIDAGILIPAQKVGTQGLAGETYSVGKTEIVDLTQYFNGDTTLINSIQTWEDFVAYDAAYSSYVAYNTGEVRGITPSAKVCGKNLFDKTQTLGLGYIKPDGTILVSNSWNYTDYINIIPNTTLTISYPSGAGNSACLAFYNKDKELISTVYHYNTSPKTYQVPVGACYLRDSLQPADVNAYQIELGSVATAYEPYQATEVTSPVELFNAGSVYDTFDVVSGVTTSKMASVDLGTLSWSYTDLLSGFFAVLPANAKVAASGKGISIICQAYPQGTSYTDKTCNAVSGWIGGKTVLIIRDSSYGQDAAALKTDITGKTLYYELATPVETGYLGTEIPLQQGVNNVLQTGGDIPAGITLGYDATEYDIVLYPNTKYLYRDGNGDEVIVTRTSTVTTKTVHGGVDKLINLTIWFGYKNEPTIQAFYKLFPTWKGADIPYIRGCILSYNGTGVQTIGFNAYNHATGTAELLGGNKYQLCGTYTSVSYVDQWGTAETLDIDSDGIFTPTNNGTLTVVDGNNTDTCVHLVWSGYKNFGEPDYKWEPFTKNIRTLAVSDYFQTGMQGFASGRDELTATGYVQRYGVKVFDGTENWSQTQGPESASLDGGIPDMANGNHMTNVACNFFIIRDPQHSDYAAGTVIAPGIIGSKSLWLFGISQTTGSTSIADLKAWIAARYAEGNPMILVYPLATPVATTFDQPLNLTYPVNDFGTEQSLPVNTTELLSTDLDADIQYSIDFTRTVQHYSEIEKDVEGLVAEKDNLARQDGYYARQGLGAATAENLVDPNAPGTERSFVSDTSCGTASIADNGRGIVEKFMGRTLVWNQQCSNGDMHNGTTGWGIAPNTGTLTADPTTHTLIHKITGPNAPSTMGFPGNGQSKWNGSHLYLFSMWLFSSKPGFNVGLVGSPVLDQTARYDEEGPFTMIQRVQLPSGWTRVRFIAKTKESATGTGVLWINLSSESIWKNNTFAVRDFQFFDLTQMFGKGREPTTIAAFRALFPDPWYDYSPNTFLNYKGTGIRTVGFNQYLPSNEYIRVRPQPYQITGTYTSLNYSQWPLYVQPTALTLNQATTATTLYSYQSTWYTANGSIADYDSTRTYKAGDVCIHDNAWMTALVDITTAEEWDSTHWEATGESTLQNTRYFHSHAMTPDSEGVFTPPDYGWLYVIGGNATDTCVHFTWSGYRNGEYEPYWENTKELPVVEQFADGMDGIAGISGDELYADKKVQKWATYTFTGNESFQWTESWRNSNTVTMCFGLAYNALVPAKQYGVTNIFSNKFATVNAQSGAFSTTDADWISGYNLNYNYSLFVRLKMSYIGATMNDTSAQAVEKFKAWLTAQYEAGTPLVIKYEMQVPVETPIDPPQEVAYPVADFGLEESVPAPAGSMGLNAVVKYSTDYTRELTHMIDENVRGRVDALDEEIEKKANKDGDYRREGLIANAAGNLVDEHAQSVPGVFTFRTTAGDESVAAQGVAQIESVKGTTHTYNQMAEDYHDNTVQGFGSVTVQDAKGGSPVSNVFQGETIVSTQLVPASQEATANGDGIVEVSTAKAGDAHSLVMTAPRSVVVNQLVQNGNFADGTNGWTPQNITLSTADNVLSLTYGLTGNRNIRKDISFVVGHTYMVTSETKDEVNGAFAFLFQITGGSVSAYVTPSNAWKRNTVKFTAAADSGACYWMLYNGALEAEVTSQMRNVMLVDLTQYFNGDQTLIDSITSWDDLVAYDPRFAGYVEYNTGEVKGVVPAVSVNNGTAITSPTPLFAVGTAADEFEAVAGVTTRKMGVVDLGTLTWGSQVIDGRRRFDTNGLQQLIKKPSTSWGAPAVCSKYLVNSSGPKEHAFSVFTTGYMYVYFSEYDDNASLKAALSGVYLYYELAEPATSTSTTTQISLQDGENLALQTDGGRAASLTLGYDTTSFSIALDATHSYYTKLSGAESIQTGLSTLAVDATQDKVMDLTRAFTHDTPSTVDQLKARYPGVASLGAYDRGSFVHLTGGTWTTGVWNQIIRGDATNLVSWDKERCTTIQVDDYIEFTRTSAGTAGIQKVFPASNSWKKGHVYMCSAYVRPAVDNQKFRFEGPSFTTDTTIYGGEAGVWQTVYARLLATDNTTAARFYIEFGTSDIAVGSSLGAVKWLMYTDLTALFGAGNEPSTVEEVRAYCASLGHDLSTYQAYDAGTPINGSVNLTGIELMGISRSDAVDTLDTESGKLVTACAVSPIYNGSENWVSAISGANYGFRLVNGLPVYGNRSYGCVVNNDLLYSYPTASDPTTRPLVWPGSASGSGDIYVYWNPSNATGVAVLPQEWLTAGDPTQPDVTGFKAWLAQHPLSVVFRRNTPVTTTVATQPITLNPGFNDFRQSSAGTLQAQVKTTYTGTSWTLKLVKNRRYLFRHEGQYSMLTPTADTTIDVVSGDKVVDLTRWGGTNALIPAQLDDIYRLYPEFAGELPYSEGELVTFRGTAIETVGFNQWDGTFSSKGKYLNANGTETAASGYDVTDFVRIVGGLEYEIAGVPNSSAAICWYDVNKNYLSGLSYSAGGRKTFAPTLACWVKFTVPTSSTETVFHLCWSGYRNYGTPGYSYEPYKKSVRELPVSEYFPDGMASDPVSGQYDELLKDKAIQRIYRKVFDGTETWSSPQNSNGNRMFQITTANLGSNLPETTRLSGSQWTVQCNLVPNYVSAYTAQIALSTGGLYWGSNASNSNLHIMLPYSLYNTVTTAAQMKQFCKDMYDAGTPLIVQWPLATPIETPIEDELNLSYNYEDFGTEELLPVNGTVPVTTPASFQIVYQQDFTRDIVNLPKNYQSQGSMGELTATLQTLLNVNILSTWDASNNLYTYAVTGDGVPGLIAAALVALAPVTGITFGVQNYLPTDGVVSIPDPTVLPITTIPDDTATYTLAEAVYQHTPASVPTYTLPTVTDGTVVHKAVVTVKMRSSVLTANFRNSQGTGITVVGPEGTVRSGTLVEYTAVYEPVARDWAVTARVVTQTEPPPDEIWYTAPSQVTLYSSTGVSSHTFENGRGVVKYTSNLTSMPDIFHSKSTVTDVRMPSGITSIKTYAFYQCSNLVYVNMPDSITSIESRAFAGCTKLVATRLPSSLVTLGVFAFQNCSKLALEEFPAGITVFPESVFQNCSSIAATKLPAGTTTVAQGAFTGCSKLALDSFPETLTTLGPSSFNGCSSITATKLPDGITVLPSTSFQNCTNMALATLPPALTGIGGYSLYSCRATTFTHIPVTVEQAGGFAIAGNTSMSALVFDGVPASISASFTNSNTPLQSIKVPWDPGEVANAPWGAVSTVPIYYGYVPSNVIGYWASDKVTLYSGTGVVKHEFANGYGRVEFSADVTTVGETFRGTPVTRLVFPAGCTGIYANAFAGCTSLTTVRIPWQADTVGDNAFQGCTSLTDAAFIGTPTSVSATAFDGCTALETIHVPWLENELTNAPWGAPGTTEIEYDFVPYDCLKYTAAQKVTLYSSASVIAHDFDDGRGLIRYQSVRTSIPNTLRGTPVQTVKISDRITSIEGNAFYGCTSLTSINLHDGITSIGTYAFQRCALMQLTRLPANLTQLTNEAFSGCKAMTITEIPATVTYLGLSPLASCTGLTEITFKGTPTSIYNNAVFYGCTNLTTIRVPWSSTDTINANAPWGATNATIIYNYTE